MLDHDFMDDGTAYGVMQFIEERRWRPGYPGNKLSLPEALAIAEMVSSAPGRGVHAKNIIHRDIKPGNIMMIKADPDAPQGEAGHGARFLGSPRCRRGSGHSDGKLGRYADSHGL